MVCGEKSSKSVKNNSLRFSVGSSDAGKLERIQERALRGVHCDNKSTYEELLHRAKLPTLLTRRLQAIAILMYKVKNGLAPPYIADVFASDLDTIIKLLLTYSRNGSIKTLSTTIK